MKKFVIGFVFCAVLAAALPANAGLIRKGAHSSTKVVRVVAKDAGHVIKKVVHVVF